MLNWTKSNEGDWQRRQQGRKHRTSLGYVGKHQEDYISTQNNWPNETAFFSFSFQPGQTSMSITSRTARWRSKKKSTNKVTLPIESPAESQWNMHGSWKHFHYASSRILLWKCRDLCPITQICIKLIQYHLNLFFKILFLHFLLVRFIWFKFVGQRFPSFLLHHHFLYVYHYAHSATVNSRRKL